jgi:hypothetical protein
VSTPHTTGALIAAVLPAVLAAGTREAFEGLLTADVHWHDNSDGQHCHTRAEAGQFYAGLLATGLTLTVANVTVDEPYVNVRLNLTWPGRDQDPVERTARLRVQDGLIAEITGLDPPPVLELLYVDDCPHHDAFLPHLRHLLAEHHIDAPITLTRIADADDAEDHRFLGSPTLRVNGRDVDPTAAGRTGYGLQCRLYTTPTGTTGTPPDQWILDALRTNPDAVAAAAAVDAVRAGDLTALTHVLAGRPQLATARLTQYGGRTLLHVATDWPGHLPNVAATITALVQAGADPNTPGLGPHPETPLHWAASSDDVEALDALLDAGADINAPGAVIAGGTPLTDATAFGRWATAHRLVERGARTTLWEAAALGLLDQVRDHLTQGDHTSDDITSSFWGACHGGQLTTATYLLDQGADINWIGYDDLTPLDAARRSGADDLAAWLVHHGARTAAPSH